MDIKKCFKISYHKGGRSMKKSILSLLKSSLIFIVVFLAGTIAANASSVSRNEIVFDNINYERSSSIRVFIDARQIYFDSNPQIINGRVLVPMNSIFSEFGLSVSWDNDTKTAIGENREYQIQFTIGESIAIINGQEQSLDVPARIINGRTMIPLRFLSENMGYNVVWIQESNIILLSRADIVEWRYEGYERTAPYKEYEVKYINGIKTSETRYTGTNYDVKFYNLYSADGRIVPNVPEFDVSRYGTGWYFESPYANKTYWIEMGSLGFGQGKNQFYDFQSINPISENSIRESADVGNYIKVKIESHYFDLDAWRVISNFSDSIVMQAQTQESLDGKVIPSRDTIFKVTVNDRFVSIIAFNELTEPILSPRRNSIYTVFERNPRTVFSWDENTWNRLKGKTPWTGMSKDMLLVQKLRRPEKSSSIQGRFSLLDLWVYEEDYVDSVFYFEDSILISMW